MLVLLSPRLSLLCTRKSHTCIISTMRYPKIDPSRVAWHRRRWGQPLQSAPNSLFQKNRTTPPTIHTSVTHIRRLITEYCWKIAFFGKSEAQHILRAKVHTPNATKQQNKRKQPFSWKKSPLFSYVYLLSALLYYCLGVEFGARHHYSDRGNPPSRTRQPM